MLLATLLLAAWGVVSLVRTPLDAIPDVPTCRSSSARRFRVRRRIAAPMIGGMITALVLSMFVVPAVCLVVRRLPMRAAEAQALHDAHGRRTSPEATGAAHADINER